MGLRAGPVFSPLAAQQIGAPLFKSSRIRKILGQGFDVIHYHNASLVGGPKLLEYGQGIKLYTMHEYWLIAPPTCCSSLIANLARNGTA